MFRGMHGNGETRPGGVSRTDKSWPLRAPSRVLSALCTVGAATLLATAAPASAETCPNAQFRTGLSAALPDCRAYELVTPPFKEGALATLQETFAIPAFYRIAGSGSRVDLYSLGNFGDAKGAGFSDHYQLTRTPTGWSETNIDPPATQFAFSEALVATPELEETLFEVARAETAAESAKESSFPKELIVREGDGALRMLGIFGSYEGASEKFAHIVYLNEGVLREYAHSGATTPIAVGSTVGGGIFDDISDSGSVVFFTDGSGVIDAQVDESETLPISEPSAVDCSACNTSAGVRAAAKFFYATPNGSQVFFETSQPLLGSDASNNVYEYDFAGPAASSENPNGKIDEISAGQWSAGGAQVQGLATVSKDGSHVYYVAKGALSGATNSQGQAPTEGSDNLYVFLRDAQYPTGHTSFIATLSPEDSSEWEKSRNTPNRAATTPDGRFLVFTSHADLTPDDTSTAQQVFEYDAQTATLVRVSIGEVGFNNDGNTDQFGALIPTAPIEGTGQPGQHTGELALSNDGSEVVFESADGLTPRALNGLTENYEYERAPGVFESVHYHPRNVYEYHDGHVYLISDGEDTTATAERSAVRLDGISPSGTDIFFETASQLVAQDTDTQADVYDARVGGGFAAPVSLLPSCSGDACQGTLSAPPVLLSPGSEFQSGSIPPPEGNNGFAPMAKPKAKTKACRRGFTRKHGKCVKNKTKRAKRSTRGRK